MKNDSKSFRYISIIFDAMDQTKCNCPHIQGSAKWSYEPRIQSQIGSFVVHGHGTYGVYWDEHVNTKDGNFWATCLLGVIKELKETDYKDKPFPEVLYIQADNASRTIRTWGYLAMYAVCELLAARPRNFSKA